MSKHFNAPARWQAVGEHDGLGRKRKTHCKHGHKFPDDARWATNWKGYQCRVCPECDRLRIQRKRENPDFKANEAAKQARWRRTHPEEYRRAYEEAFAKKRQILFDARAGGCIKCGETHPWCLDFHHREGTGKLGHIGVFRKFGTARLLAEIAKCDVLCANCHRKHHGDEFMLRAERIKARHGHLSETAEGLQSRTDRAVRDV
jgi:hypothetical protein